MGVELLRPSSLQEAVDSLSALGERARPLAGGTALVLLLGQGLLSLDCLVDLRHIPGLDKIEHEPGTGLALGALVSHRAIERSPLVRAQLPFLAEVFHHVANVRVRNQATVGGVLAEADYASDPPAALIALNARVRVIGPDGERELSVAELLRGWYETSLAGGEIIRDVVVPDPPPDTKFAYRRFVSRSTQDRPCASIAIALRSSGDHCAELRVVVGAVAATPQRISGPGAAGPRRAALRGARKKDRAGLRSQDRAAVRCARLRLVSASGGGGHAAALAARGRRMSFVPYVDAHARVTGQIEYVLDMTVPHMLHAAVTRCDVAHGYLRRVDTSAALAVPGVVAALTGADLEHVGIANPYFGSIFKDQPVLAIDRVRFVGEPVAAIAAVDAETARHAASLVEVEIEEIDAVFDVAEAIGGGRTAAARRDAASAWVRGRQLCRAIPGETSSTAS